MLPIKSESEQVTPRFYASFFVSTLDFPNLARVTTILRSNAEADWQDSARSCPYRAGQWPGGALSSRLKVRAAPRSRDSDQVNISRLAGGERSAADATCHAEIRDLAQSLLIDYENV